jgi:hypothetical protein
MQVTAHGRGFRHPQPYRHTLLVARIASFTQVTAVADFWNPTGREWPPERPRSTTPRTSSNQHG